jgi:hypothetical protein
MPQQIILERSGKMRWMGHVARIGELNNIKKFSLVNLNGSCHSEDGSLDERIILE